MAFCANPDIEATCLLDLPGGRAGAPDISAEPGSGPEGLPERRHPRRALILGATALGAVAVLVLGAAAAGRGARPGAAASRAPATGVTGLFSLGALLPWVKPSAAPAPAPDEADAVAAGGASMPEPYPGALLAAPTPAPELCFQTEDGSDVDGRRLTAAEKYCVVSNTDQDKGPAPLNLYMYRAGGESDYDLENVNAADLEGVMWYLHNEVVTSAPRKYGIDRIRRYQVTVKNTQEFWNVHKTQFGPFLAFDAAKCTTVDANAQASTCENVFQKYGFIIGCQPVQAIGGEGQAGLGYLHDTPSNTGCAPGSPECYAPLWYSLPGPCPEFGIPQNDIDANDAEQDVQQYKTPECNWRMPGGRCEEATGAPDCTYSVWPAGEIMLDDLAGIEDYDDWWNTSYYRCINEGGSDCAQNKEYSVEIDGGVGTDFWNNRGDRDACKARVDAVKRAFADRYPDAPYQVDEPVCDFDMVYNGEFQWPLDHTGGAKSTWWTDHNGPAPSPVYAPSYSPSYATGSQETQLDS